MTEALHTKTEILTEIAPKNLNSKKAHILKSLFHFLVYSFHSTLFKIYKKWSVSLGIMEFNGACSRKTYEKWYVRPQDPTNSWGFTDEAAKCVQEKVVTPEMMRTEVGIWASHQQNIQLQISLISADSSMKS